MSRAPETVIIRLNMLFLLMIVLLPFVTRVLGVDSDFAIGPVLYASVVSATCFVLGSMAIVASKQRLLHHGESTTASAMAGGLFASGAVFLVSIPIAFWSTSVALYSWLVLSVLLHYAGELLAKLRKRPNPLTTDRWET